MKPDITKLGYRDYKAISELVDREYWNMKLRAFYWLFEGEEYYLKKRTG